MEPQAKATSQHRKKKWSNLSVNTSDVVLSARSLHPIAKDCSGLDTANIHYSFPVNPLARSTIQKEDGPECGSDSENDCFYDAKSAFTTSAAASAAPLTPHKGQTPLYPKGNGPEHRALSLTHPSSPDQVQGSFFDSVTPTPVDIGDISAPASMSPARHSRRGANDPDDVLEDDELRIGTSPPASVRDSHGLSLPHRQVRDSLVANMLLSLDQFSLDQMHTSAAAPSNNVVLRSTPLDPFADDMPLGGRSMTIASRLPARGGGHQLNYSSDYEGGEDSSRVSRGRRSNSSSGFQSNLGRINSIREGNLRSQSTTPRQMHSRGGAGSKSSSTSSLNVGYAQVLGSQRWAHGFGRRSSSFDYGPRRPSLSHQSTAPPALGNSVGDTLNSTSPWHIEFSSSFFNDEYDAAPTPTIPSGPRRFHPSGAHQPSTGTSPSKPHKAASTLAAATFIPQSPPLEPPNPDTVDLALDHQPKALGLERRKSTRSTRSLSTPGRKNTMTRDRSIVPAPAVSEADLDAAPAPHVGYGKSKEPVLGTSIQTPPVKEKQGFFRRVFGLGGGGNDSSRSNSNNGSENNTSSNTNRFSSPGHPSPSSLDSQSRSNPPSRDSHHATHVLQKKPSSFFRRRKKSFTTEEAPPVPTVTVQVPPAAAATAVCSSSPAPAPTSASTCPPAMPPPIMLSTEKEHLTVTADPSPVSSLRRVMNPYLKSSSSPNAPLQSPLGAPPQTHIPTSVEPERTMARGFSPDYEPPPSATIRSVNTNPLELKSARKIKAPKRRATDEPPRRLETPIRNAPNQSSEPDATFLHDNSENELESPNTSKNKREKKSKQPVGLHSSPDSKPPPIPNRAASRDMMLKSSTSTPRLKPLPSPETAEKGTRDSLALPIEGARSNRSSQRLSHATSLPSLRLEGREMHSPKLGGTMLTPKATLDEPEVVLGDPTQDDRKKAQMIYDGNEDFIQKQRAAAWMGEEGHVRQRTLKAYMELYDFVNLSILAALRLVCGRLVLRGETQQVDRILVAFSNRWCECNSNHGFKAMDIIHTICYSIMLLNTDLHLADIEHKMTRNQFIKNTMGTVHAALEESAPDAFEHETNNGRRTSGENEKRNFRLSLMPSGRPISGIQQTNGEKVIPDDCGPLVKSTFEGSRRAWEGQVESVLKDIYNSIRDEKLPLFGAEPERSALGVSSQSSLSVMNVLKRTPSVLSKAPSESGASSRGRMTENRNNRWASKSRSRPRGMGTAGMNSSRTSFDDNTSVWSPTVSSATWSKYSLGRTQTSMSMESFGSSWPRAEYQHSIGFATALSHAIIREEALGNGTASIMSDEPADSVLLEDESLELAGPPWVKEGIVTHKHHLDGIDKKAKDRNWTQIFAVIQKGCLSMFSFSGTKSLGRKNRLRTSRSQILAHGGVVGGGNWQDNATNMGTFNLRQALASILPPPGYSRSRPNVWALSLPTGAVHLFQVGTPEICKEFVSTANYWSARLSTHPLVGGMSNIEYGWSDSVVNNALVMAINETESGGGSRPGSAAVGPLPSSSHSHHGPGHRRRSSAQSKTSLRSSIDHAVGRTTTAVLHGGGKLPGDKINISEWTPPQQSMRPSNSPEAEQLATLQSYVKSIEEELQRHNQLRSPMLLAFTPRGNNAAKAMQNWERKSSYLLREIVKFRTYVDVLLQANKRKEEIYKEREGVKREVTEALGVEFPMPGNLSVGGSSGGTPSHASSGCVSPQIPGKDVHESTS